MWYDQLSRNHNRRHQVGIATMLFISLKSTTVKLDLWCCYIKCRIFPIRQRNAAVSNGNRFKTVSSSPHNINAWHSFATVWNFKLIRLNAEAIDSPMGWEMRCVSFNYCCVNLPRITVTWSRKKKEVGPIKIDATHNVITSGWKISQFADSREIQREPFTKRYLIRLWTFECTDEYWHITVMCTKTLNKRWHKCHKGAFCHGQCETLFYYLLFEGILFYYRTHDFGLPPFFFCILNSV